MSEETHIIIGVEEGVSLIVGNIYLNNYYGFIFILTLTFIRILLHPFIQFIFIYNICRTNIK